jgi:hypothetical protein
MSRKFISHTRQKIVIASGAISFERPWKVSFTMPLTNSTIISTKHCSLPGTPAVALRATEDRNAIRIRISRTLKKTLSRWTWKKPSPPPSR